MTDLVERLNAGLNLLDSKLHTLTSAADVATALGLRDVLTETRDEIERLDSEVERLIGESAEWKAQFDVMADRYAELHAENTALRSRLAESEPAIGRSQNRQLDATSAPDSASGNRCAYCGVPDGDGHTGDCQHPALSDQPSSADEVQK